MTKTNFHTHTYRCGHAVGDEVAMVEWAIKNGIEVLGFSCHVPLPHYRRHLLSGLSYIKDMRSFLSFSKAFIKNGPAMRMPYSQKREHQQAVTKLKEKYKDQITIYQGFEAEYFEEYEDYYQEMLSSGEIDYLILGHHFNKVSIHSRYYGKEKLSEIELVQYKDDVLRAFDTNLFSYFAHPDLFMIGMRRWDAFCEQITREICIKAKEKNIPLEINAGGMRRGLRKVDKEMVYPYPNTHFWDIVSEIGNTVVLGIDAHSPDDFNEASFALLQEFAKKHNLQVVDTFEFKKGNIDKHKDNH